MTCPAAFAQKAYRGRNDDGNETTASWKAAQNTNWEQIVDTNLRVRFEIQETAACAGANKVWQLQYNKNAGGWVTVNASSLNVRSSASSNLADAANLTDQLTAGTGTFVGATGFDEVDGAAGGTSMDVAASGHSEAEFCIQFRSADLAEGDSVQLRVTDAGVALAAYDATPTVTATFTLWSATEPFTYSAGTGINAESGGTNWATNWSWNSVGTEPTVESSGIPSGMSGTALKVVSTTANTLVSRTFTGISSGIMKIRLAWSNTSPNDFKGFHLDEGGAGKMYIKADAGDIKMFNSGTGYETLLAGISADTEYRIDIEFNDATNPDQYRARVDGGTWSAFKNTNGGWANIDGITIDSSATSACTMWIDDIGKGNVADAGGVTENPSPVTAAFSVAAPSISLSQAGTAVGSAAGVVAPTAVLANAAGSVTFAGSVQDGTAVTAASPDPIAAASGIADPTTVITEARDIDLGLIIFANANEMLGLGATTALSFAADPAAAVFSVPTPSVTGGGTVETPSPVTVSAGVVAPALGLANSPDATGSIAAVAEPSQTLTFEASPIIAALSVPTPSTGGDVVETPDPVSAALGVAAPTFSLTVASAPVTATFSVPAVTAETAPRNPRVFDVGLQFVTRVEDVGGEFVTRIIDDEVSFPA